MEDNRQKRAGFQVVETVIAVAIVLVLVVSVVPTARSRREGAWRVLSNARQIHQATYRMVLDNVVRPSPELGWPGDLAVAVSEPVATSGQFVERLAIHNYIDRSSLAYLFSGPGLPVYPGTGSFAGKYSVFAFYKITAADEDAAIFLATKNFRFGAKLDPKAPYGEKGCVIVRKGGDALMLTSGHAMNTNFGVMPGGSKENPGVQEGNTLRD